MILEGPQQSGPRRALNRPASPSVAVGQPGIFPPANGKRSRNFRWHKKSSSQSKCKYERISKRAALHCRKQGRALRRPGNFSLYGSKRVLQYVI